MKATEIISHLILASTTMALLGGSILQMHAQSNSENDQRETETNLEDRHKRHEQFADRFAQKGFILLLKKYSLPSESREQLKQVIDAYLEVKDALARDDPEAADGWAIAMRKRIEIVDKEQIDGDGLKALNQHSKLMLESLQHFQHVESLDKKRSYFSHISEIAYCTVKSFELEYEDLYSLYCPLAFSGNGANWLSITSESKNPYFGMSVNNCGDISFEYLGTRKTSYISPFGRSK